MKKILLGLTILLVSLPVFSQKEDESKTKLARAAEAMRGKRYLEAEQIYQSIVNENPDDISTKQLLCHALINEEKFLQADSMLRRMQEADSNNVGNYWYMGISAQKQHQDSLRVLYFKRYIKKTENSLNQQPKAWLFVGSAYRVMMHTKGINIGQYDDMVYHYNRYLQLSPEDLYGGELKMFLENVALKKPEKNGVLVWDEAK